jgi:ribosome recycling factor
MDHKNVVKESRERMKKAVEVLQTQYHGMRTGRANPGLVEDVRVDYYGSLTPLKQIASISAPEANLLVVKAFDASSLGAIEKAIQKADLGIQPSNDGKVVRLIIPPLSEDRRKQLVQHAKQLAEEARVALRNVRRDANKRIEQFEKDSEISEDVMESMKKETQGITDEHTRKVDETFEKKSTELMQF